MQEVVVIAIALSAAVSLLAHVHALVSRRSEIADWLGILAISTLTLGGLLYEANVLPRGQVMQFAIFGVIASAVGLAAARSLRSQERGKAAVGLAVFLPALISASMFLTNAIANPQLPLEQSLGRLLAVAIPMIVGLGVPVFSIDMTDLLRVMLISILAMLIIAPLTKNIWRPCDIFKCGPFAAIYTGPFSSENALAIFSCVGILCTLALKAGRGSLWAIVPLGLTLYATESRTSQLALGAALVAWLISLAWRKISNASQPLKSQTVIFSAGVIAVSATSFYVMFHAQPNSFSNRGNIWIRGLGALGPDWWSGLGLDRWTYLQSAGILPLLFPHNENLLLLFGGGIVPVLLLVVMLIISIRRGVRSKICVGFSISYVMFLSVLGITEAYWNPVALDGHTFLVLPLVILMSMKAPAGRARVPSPSSSLKVL